MILDLEGLTPGCRIAPAVLGHRGSRLVVDVSGELQHAIDERSGLPFCPVQGVFHNPNAVFLGFGTPNVFTMLPNEGGWDKFAAFMFYRQRSYVANVTDRMQVGVYFELRNLPQEALEALRQEMDIQQGRRSASCANANARVFTAAGFTCGGKSLARVYRPSHLAALIWEHGLEYKGEPVAIRVIQSGREIGDHFVAVWLKEFTSLCRTIKKKFLSRGHDPSLSAPKFEARQHEEGTPVAEWQTSTDFTTIGISRPSRLGVWLGFILGQRPIFSAELDEPIDAPVLDTPLVAFPGKLDRVTKFKRYVLFSRPVVWFIRRHLTQNVDQYNDVPSQAVVEMLRRSNSPQREEAFVYNLVMTPRWIRIARLENQNGRDRKLVNWIMAKHVLVSGYDPDVLFAGEMWCCRVDGKYVIYLSGNSGTYKPAANRLLAAANVLARLFGARVEIVAH